MCEWLTMNAGQSGESGYRTGDFLSVQADGQRWGRRDSVARWVEDGGTVETFPNPHYAIFKMPGYRADLDTVDGESEQVPSVPIVKEFLNVEALKSGRIETRKVTDPRKRTATADRAWCLVWRRLRADEKTQMRTGYRTLTIPMEEVHERGLIVRKFDYRAGDRPTVFLPRQDPNDSGDRPARRYGTTPRDRQKGV